LRGSSAISGQVQVMFNALSGSIEHIRTGKLRALAVTSISRYEALPDLPTVADFLPGFEASFWVGVGAPKNTPAEIIGKLNKEINTALADPVLKARFADLGGTVLPGSSADFGKPIAERLLRHQETQTSLCRGPGVDPMMPPGARTRRSGAFYDMRAVLPAAMAKNAPAVSLRGLFHMLHLGNTFAELTRHPRHRGARS
jgi:hypothetical protein